MKSSTEQNHFSCLVRLNSKDRINGTTTDFRVRLGNEFKNRNVKRIVISSVNFPNFQYNINANTNTLTINSTTEGTQNIVINQGQYSANQLITSLDTAINVAFTDTYTLTLNARTSGITVTNTTANTFTITPASSMATILGFSTAQAPATTQTGIHVRLNGLTQAYVRSNYLAIGNLHGSEQRERDYLSTVQVREPYGSYVYYEAPYSDISSIDYIRPRKVDNDIDIALLDQNEQVIDLHGYDIDLELIVYYR